jgi:hypothetical protein
VSRAALIADFRRKWATGASLMAAVLLEILKQADENGAPFERWTAGHFDMARKHLHAALANMRQTTSGQEQFERLRREGADPDPSVMKVVAKEMRKHYKRIEPEAIGFLNILEKRALGEETREQTCIFIREWRKASEGMTMSPAHLAKSLQDYLRHDHLNVPSDNLTRQFLETIERADFVINDDRPWPFAQGTASRRDEVESWTYEIMPLQEGKRREQLFLVPAGDIDEKMRSAMAAYAASLGDLDSDLMIFAMARFAERAKHPDDLVKITIDELMEALGYAPHRGGGSGESYTVQDKNTVRRRLEKLQDGFLSIRRAGKDPRTKRSVDIESVVLTIEDRIGQADLNGRIPDWTAIRVRFGRAWAHRLFEPDGRLTAQIQRQALAYDPRKERLEKRLLKRLGWYWKLNSRRVLITPPRPVRTWITEDIGDELQKYSERRDAERLEQAFDRLKVDESIGAWGYVDGLSKITAMKESLPRGWLDKWLEREITVEAPEALQIAYQQRLPARPEVEAITDTGLGARFRAFRISHRVSATRAAGDMGVSGAALSLVETGKRLPSAEMTRKMEGWLRDMSMRPDLRAENAGA